jgi:hypothetical protein
MRKAKTVTAGRFMAFGPCAEYPEGRIRRIAGDKEEWGALDILALGGVPAKDRLWAVLREDLIDAPVLHEFACRCAERALALVPDPDPRSIEGLAAKRRWLAGEATDEELEAAAGAAWAAEYAAGAAAGAAAETAAWAAAEAAARGAGAAVGDAAYTAARAAAETAGAAGAAAEAAEQERQIAELRRLMAESGEGGQG